MSLDNSHKKKILYSAIQSSHILNFHIPYLKWLKENNYEVYVITRDKCDIPYCDVKIEVDFPKGINIIKTIKAIRKVKEIIEKERMADGKADTPQVMMLAEKPSTRMCWVRPRQRSKRNCRRHWHRLGRLTSPKPASTP